MVGIRNLRRFRCSGVSLGLNDAIERVAEPEKDIPFDGLGTH
jgi:hypothetical protein